MQLYYHLFDYLQLALGLGFVIFFHELGHFLAAKYCDVKVEQFAVGFGPAIFAWRRGIGFRSGTTAPDYQRQLERHLESQDKKSDADRGEGMDYKASLSPSAESVLARKLGLGETEYRLNWIPLGGYVKMLGQDDLRPGVTADDPRSYNSKPIRSRMLIVSAGVIMNVLLAAIAFAIVYRMGLPVPPAIVGGLVSESPAMKATRADHTRAGLQLGDTILSYNGYNTIGDFSKLQLYTALSHEGTTVPVVVKHLNGVEETLYIEPAYSGGDRKGLLGIGVIQPFQLSGVELGRGDQWDEAKIKQMEPADSIAIRPGDVITQIGGVDVAVNESWKLVDALMASDGKPVDLTVKSADGKVSRATVSPHFQASFGRDSVSFLGMVPRARVEDIASEESPVLGKLKPDDVIVGLSLNNADQVNHPAPDQIQEKLYAAGDKKTPVTLSILSPGEAQPHDIPNVVPSVHVENKKIGLGIRLAVDEQHLVVAKTLADSPADNKVPAGATLTEINGLPVQNWFQVRRMIADAKAGDIFSISFTVPGEEGSKVARIAVEAENIAAAQMVALTDDLQLRSMSSPLKTTNPLIAAKWAVIETRDLILSFYLTLQRMVTGDVSSSNLMGPVGMVTAGAQVARRGVPSLLWFLAAISANLAVVNFLPFPIVDGGLFTLLILEKIQGKPLSPDVQKIVQIVGLALILGVFMFVTYQDIARIARI